MLGLLSSQTLFKCAPAITLHIAANHTQLPYLCRLLSAYSQFQRGPFMTSHQAIGQALG